MTVGLCSLCLVVTFTQQVRLRKESFLSRINESMVSCKENWNKKNSKSMAAFFNR